MAERSGGKSVGILPGPLDPAVCLQALNSPQAL